MLPQLKFVEVNQKIRVMMLTVCHSGLLHVDSNELASAAAALLLCLNLSVPDFYNIEKSCFDLASSLSQPLTTELKVDSPL